RVALPISARRAPIEGGGGRRAERPTARRAPIEGRGGRRAGGSMPRRVSVAGDAGRGVGGAAPRRSMLLRRRRRRSGRRRREEVHGRLLVAPTLLVVGGVVVLPMAAVLVLSVQDLRLIEVRSLSLGDLGLTFENFARVLSGPGFWAAVRTTVVYAVLTTAGSLAAGLMVALALRRPFPGRGAVRALMLVPYALPVVAGTTIWTT